MSQDFSCPCDTPVASPPSNPPGLGVIAYRDTDYVDIRAALLTPLAGETQLNAWRPGAGGDLALMMAEWFAYLGDIITFYNERIANEDYLGTATQARSVNNLIRLLGYRPQPGVGASVTLAALRQGGQNFGQVVTLPAGLQVTSKPSPGQTPQTFELSAKTALAATDAVTATAPLALLAPSRNTILLAGAVGGILGGDFLLLRSRAGGAPRLVAVGSAALSAPPNALKQTVLSVSFPNDDAPIAAAASLRLDRPTLTASLWTLTPNYLDSAGNIHLSGLLRAVQPGDPLLFVIAGGAPVLASVGSLKDVIWDATGAVPTATSKALFAHTQLTLAGGAIPAGTPAGNVTLLYHFVEAATLVDQPVPVWPGPNAADPPALVSASLFPSGNARPVLIADATGAGIAAQASANANGISISGMASPAPDLQTPLTVLYNPLPFTRGKTVANEVLGSGDPTVANQSFALAKSPLTYLRPAAALVSTLSVTVNGQGWTEVANLFGQPANAKIFVTAQDEAQKTTVIFGDGVNGARLPSGIGNVIAHYRYGSGAAAPPAGALSVIATPYPGLRAMLNPVGAGGGADPDPAAQIQTYAPRSVLTFGRAVSAADYQAIAARIAAGTRVSASWAWDPANQRGGVIVYVADNGAVLASVQSGLAAVGDPNRPAAAVPATPILLRLGIEMLITAAADAATVQAAITTALTDPAIGLFGAANCGIGQSVFDSQIAAACQAVPGFVAIAGLWFHRSDQWRYDTYQMHRCPEHCYFDLDPSDVFYETRVAGNG